MFVPPCCPHPLCASQLRGGFTYQCRGVFRRKLDGRVVQRYRCGVCGRFFSDQSFRLDYGLRRPELTKPAFWSFVSKVTQRQAARELECARGTIRHRLELLGKHCREFHELQRRRLQGALDPQLALDELETYESDRRLKPLTVPVLIHEPTWFVLDTQVAPLASRGGLAEHHERRKQALIEREGKRVSGSREAVRRCLCNVAPLLARDARGLLRSDEKQTYVALKRSELPASMQHARISSKEPRGLDNPLFRINCTLAMLRDGVSRLVRRTWGASKKGEQLEKHLWIWIVYRNYVRRMVNRSVGQSAASMLKLFDGPLATDDLLGLAAAYRSDPPQIRAAS